MQVLGLGLRVQDTLFSKLQDAGWGMDLSLELKLSSEERAPG